MGAQEELVFRQHWSVLVKPVVVSLLCSGLIFGALMLIGLDQAPWLLGASIVPLIPIGWRFLAWYANRYVFRDGRLVHEWGIFSRSELALDYSFSYLTFGQSSWDKLLDCGNVELGLGASRAKLERIGRFREFKSILTNGQLTDLEWKRKNLLAEGIFAWASLLVSGIFAATLSTVLSFSGLADELSFSIPLVVASLLLISAHVIRYWQRNYTITLPTRKPPTATYRKVETSPVIKE